MTKKSTSASRKVEPLWIPIDRLIPNSWNPNQQDQNVFELLKDEIAENGNLAPLQVVPLPDGNYRIIGGEHRWKASKELGEDEMLCVVLKDKKWEELDLQRFVTVRLNSIHGKLDPDKFLALYKDLASKYGEESMQRMMGYADAKAFQRMLGWVKKGLKQSLPKEMAKDVDEAAKEVKTVADLGNVIQDLFQKYGDTLQFSYMIFQYGKQDHLYISTNAKSRKALGRVMEACRILKKDINEFFEPILSEASKRAVKEIEAAKSLESEKDFGVAVEKEPW